MVAEFEGMWDYPTSGHWERSASQLAGTLAIEGKCVFVIDEDVPRGRFLISLPRELPVFESGERMTGIENAVSWQPTQYSAETGSLWVGDGERVRVGDRVVLSGHPIDGDWFNGDCIADAYWRAGSIELWP